MREVFDDLQIGDPAKGSGWFSFAPQKGPFNSSAPYHIFRHIQTNLQYAFFKSASCSTESTT